MTDSSAEKKGRILLLQDDPIIVGLVSGTLRPEGHDIIVADGPMEALNITRQEFQTIDLVVTRIDMKPITGLEFARRLVQQGIDVPMLFMSASRSMVSVIGHSLGQSAVIEEPFTAAELRSSVKKCLSLHRRKSEKSRPVAN
jgi:two-component system cell cycle sensor histidine kinase/response regulator CckA